MQEQVMFFWEIVKLIILTTATVVSIKVFTKQSIEKYFITQNAENQYLRERQITHEKRIDKVENRVLDLEDKLLKIEEIEIREIHQSLSNVKGDVSEVKRIVENNSQMQERLYQSLVKIINALNADEK